MPTNLEVLDADITTLAVDAIVNAANCDLAPGGGVCGAIHAAAGPELAEECRKLGRCETGEAKISAGYGLPAAHVIHAVGPVWGGGESGEDASLASCYRNALNVAREHGLTSLAFPAISTGIYGFPPPRAAAIAAKTVHEETAADDHFKRIIFCCFGAESVELHTQALAELAQ